MPKRSRRFQAHLANLKRDHFYLPDEAMKMTQDFANAKFDETIEIHLRMGVDPRHADQQIRGVVTLPNGVGREVKIVVFASPDGQALAREAGADHVGADELATEIQNGWTDFSVVLATPDMMRVVGKLGRILGPRGLMPSPKTGTIVPAEDLPRVIEEARLGRIEYRVDKTSNIHVPIGKASFETPKLMQNLGSLMEAVMGAKPSSLKGIYLQRATVTSTMGPGVKMDTTAVAELRADQYGDA
ncbi:50S ribosomal protein L1 [Chloroflexi bacterium TSY]|nr:50S ribosomal protein L1 [Chloroflexi bacterium TSY]